MALELLWYAVIGCAILFYTILDGFDLGVGSLHLFAKTDEQRRIFLNAIGPVWDGNEVWIIIVIGGLFAGFPEAYASVFSAFYTPFMILIACLIFRAVAIEFRSKQESKKWRALWDGVFSISSHVIAFLLGVVLGNVILGIPINASQDYIGDFSLFLRPYALLIGLLSVSLFAMHGAIFLHMKTEGETQEIIKKWINPAILVFLFWYVLATLVTLLYIPHMTDGFRERPWLLMFPVISMLAIANIPYQIRNHNAGLAFVSSCISIAFLLILFALGTYPVLVLSTIDPEMNSLTIFNTASSQKTLFNLLVVVAIGLPLVFCYMFWVYKIFHGKVRLTHTSY